MLTVFTNQIKEVICDFKTSQMGWYVFLDGEKHFWARKALMELFGDIQTAVITENDQEAIERRNKLFRSSTGQESIDWSCRSNGDYDEFDPPPATSCRRVYANA